MNFRRTNSEYNNLHEQSLIYAEFNNGSFELKHLNGLDLKDSEVEFIHLKRMRNKKNVAAPDPRLGDYET